jgi:hypothetical protein
MTSDRAAHPAQEFVGCACFVPERTEQVEVDMANEFKPSVDQWYLRPGNADMFRVVAVDNGTIDIQSFDGDVEELDLDAWRELDIELAEPPENWTGPFDSIEADDLDETESAMRKVDGRASASIEPRFREDEAWQDARPIDEQEEEEDGSPAEPSTESAGERATRKPH